MKKSLFWCLVFICCTCLAMIGGFLIGRNQNHAVVVVSEETEAITASGKVNINTADSLTLQTLPGIGEELAQRIIVYRQNHGSFATVGDLIQVEGISTDILQNILDYITTGG